MVVMDRVEDHLGELEIEVNLRPKNQLTLPEPIAKRMHVRPGDRLIFYFVENEDEPRVRRLLPSYAGILAGVYGDNEDEVAQYIREERTSWSD